MAQQKGAKMLVTEGTQGPMDLSTLVPQLLLACVLQMVRS